MDVNTVSSQCPGCSGTDHRRVNSLRYPSNRKVQTWSQIKNKCSKHLQHYATVFCSYEYQPVCIFVQINLSEIFHSHGLVGDLISCLVAGYPTFTSKQRTCEACIFLLFLFFKGGEITGKAINVDEDQRPSLSL
ncbi:hypothetical protein PHYBLDRAFT_168554 [Phycomyces blakesleeanus NRRL 1555(-)]|uniref:Uncharacterized protein n=1 Tax=Phycomyces blakesleeanus (strain ATCC 8743b / DSM 1359 / FGSC 10004 / NBRC 33097 / NRRL 1555) TaxID=763407 RepID=A0A162U3M8_PHYB8|nr:hypothetical protein PHYBLDRAFT_168554 [Phycomyces blakesleeanus NRRL 1555(-)]OAD73202.1 hypothetical protein PHYBLDRAFT_168554 [Phycomyces blakesleeanus NRRL 1555(-)]|eukprot:XP_018291242.1 hypothetical protein PHYBLDRAFT_168554 [Phycomyces blakesleeanus NRRL 1555(-)]